MQHETLDQHLLETPVVGKTSIYYRVGFVVLVLLQGLFIFLTLVFYNAFETVEEMRENSMLPPDFIAEYKAAVQRWFFAAVFLLVASVTALFGWWKRLAWSRWLASLLPVSLLGMTALQMWEDGFFVAVDLLSIVIFLLFVGTVVFFWLPGVRRLFGSVARDSVT